ncbi:hypothetical protein PFICI_11839 [Pestalotiopsis fici W106-1]|uniref:Uncharacterized protein n=1 Tax=Pestalotiopsis fici (strain W106-1 / CGMCC3.15140) TaxID=1229662 RepID=W3WTG6_PESFW|nr:uncharacterized protein PFICI_11839 [Pestalotiopsis fici W106-1]ETS76452.1 hypothetical protein PFICI_11839 [Pestalotiopsis fici W106-1]
MCGSYNPHRGKRPRGAPPRRPHGQDQDQPTFTQGMSQDQPTFTQGQAQGQPAFTKGQAQFQPTFTHGQPPGQPVYTNLPVQHGTGLPPQQYGYVPPAQYQPYGYYPPQNHIPYGYHVPNHAPPQYVQGPVPQWNGPGPIAAPQQYAGPVSQTQPYGQNPQPGGQASPQDPSYVFGSQEPHGFETRISDNGYNPKRPGGKPRGKKPAPPEAWVPLHKDELRKVLERDPASIPRLPADRNKIWHQHCGQMHAPEFCRGPLDGGVLNTCGLCGGAYHLTETCLYWDLIDEDKRDSLENYLFIFARQSLAPLAATIDMKDRGQRDWSPPLSPFAAAMYEDLQFKRDQKARRGPYYKTFKYHALADVRTELERLPPADPCLGIWINSGPPPNHQAAGAFNDYLNTDHANKYSPRWTLFTNHPVALEGKRVVSLPEWVIGVDSIVESNNRKMKNKRSLSPDHVSQGSSPYTGRPADKRRKLNERQPISGRHRHEKTKQDLDEVKEDSDHSMLDTPKVKTSQSPDPLHRVRSASLTGGAKVKVEDTS